MPLNYKLEHEDKIIKGTTLWGRSNLSFEVTGPKHQVKYIADQIAKSLGVASTLEGEKKDG